MIPEELFQAVAQLLAYVYRVAGRAPLAEPPHERIHEASAGKHADLLAAGAVVLVVVMMIIPLPPFLLDLAITLNISAALMIVVATLYVPARARLLRRSRACCCSPRCSGSRSTSRSRG